MPEHTSTNCSSLRVADPASRTIFQLAALMAAYRDASVLIRCAAEKCGRTETIRDKKRGGRENEGEALPPQGGGELEA